MLATGNLRKVVHGRFATSSLKKDEQHRRVTMPARFGSAARSKGMAATPELPPRSTHTFSNGCPSF